MKIIWELVLPRSVDEENGTSFFYPGDMFTEEGLFRLFHTQEGVEWAKKLGVVKARRIQNDHSVGR